MDTAYEYAEQQAKAWEAVCVTLTEVMPRWTNGPECGLEKAVQAIRKLAAMAENNLKVIEEEVLRRRGIHPMQSMGDGSDEDDHDRDDRNPIDEHEYIDPFEDA